MLYSNRCGKVNVKLLLILVVVTVALGVSLVVARQVRRSILSKRSLTAGEAAFQNQDWPATVRNYREYLGRNPDNVDILRKYAKALLSVRPLEGPAIAGAISVYRRLLQLDPVDAVASEKLAMLYAGIGNAEELAYTARKRLESDPNDRNAPLWLADALLQLNKRQEAQQTLDRFAKALETRPGKYAEYVQACARLSQIMALDDSGDAKAKALEWLNKAVRHDPDSAEARGHRARFYRETPAIADMNETRRLALARQDLEVADRQDTDDARVRLLLAVEWMAHGELNRAAAELQAADKLPQEKLEEYFLDINGWRVARFLFASDLATRRGALSEAVTLADEALTVLTEKRHRVRVLPTAVTLYVAAGKASDARRCLNEYLDLTRAQTGAAESKWRLAYLQALVAKAEDRLYAVIDVLQPVMVSDASRPELWRLLAEAYSRTDQSRRAVGALINYLRYYPRDPEMTLQQAKEYLKLRDWNRAFETARLAEPLNPTDIILRLLRIEASIYIAAEERQTIDKARLDELSAELAQMRTDHPDRVDIRILQSMIADYREQPDQAESELKLAIQECKEPLRAQMQLVRHYYRLKRLAEAVAVCRQSCKQHPEVAEPWISLSSLHAANGDPNAARGCLKEGLQTVVSKWEKRSVAMRLAQLELTSGDRSAGMRLLSELAAQDEYEVYARVVLLSVREVREDRATAEKLIQELHKAEGESGLWWRFHQASRYLSSDDWRSKQQDITGYLQFCIDSDPEWSAPVLLLVDLYEKLQDSRRTEDICRQALVRNPSATDIADRLITLLEKQGRVSDAEQVLQKVEADPRVASAWHVRMALRAGDFSRAIDELKLRVSSDNRDADSRVLLARLTYWQSKDADQAFKYLKEAEAIGSSSIALTAVRVAILKAEGQAQEAQRVLDDYVTHRSDFSAYMMRAAYLANVGDLERAEQDYRKLITFADKGTTGYELLSNFYARSNKSDQAVTALEEGLKQYPADLRLERRLIKTLLLRGRTQDRQKALTILSVLEERLPQDPELMKIRALALLEEPTAQSREAAKKKLETVVKLEPTAADAHLALIGLALAERGYEKARDLAVRALGSNPNNLALLAARGRAEIALGNPRLATEVARLAIQKDPNSTETLDVLLAAALRAKDNTLLQEARTLIGSALGRNPPSGRLLLARATVWSSLGLPQATIELAHMVLQKDPNNVAAVNVIVGAALTSKDRALLEKARTMIEPLAGREPPNGQVILSWVRVLASLDLPQTAIPRLETYCRTKEGSRNVGALVTLADLYRLSGNAEQAKVRIDQATKTDPNSPIPVHARLLWLVSQKRFEDLKGISSAFLSAKEQNPEILVAAASVLAALDSMELKKESLKLFEHVLTLSPTLVEARLGLASTLYQTGDAERAKGIYEELLKQHPNDKRVLNDLAWVLQEHDHNYSAALELANQGLSADPNDAHLLDTRGTILANLPQRLTGAKNDFQKLVKLSPDDSREKAKSLLQLARVYVKLKDMAQAKQSAEKALQIDQKLHVFTLAEQAEIAEIMRKNAP
jgi:tetratricopeptide (TPR) repeat protein